MHFSASNFILISGTLFAQMFYSGISKCSVANLGYICIISGANLASYSYSKPNFHILGAKGENRDLILDLKS